MVPSNILQRTFHISHNGQSGTAFTVDTGSAQHLVTAKHVVAGLASSSSLSVMRSNAWLSVPVADVWFSPTGADIAVATLRQPLSPNHHIQIGDCRSFFLSQPIFFLGFPYGMNMAAGQSNNHFPVPFAKAGIISSFSNVANGSQIIYCDGHNNPGFSGGPILTVSSQSVVTVIGVVSAYRHNDEPILLNGTPTGLSYRANTGIVVGYGLTEVLAHLSSLP